MFPGDGFCLAGPLQANVHMGRNLTLACSVFKDWNEPVAHGMLAWEAAYALR